MLLLLFLQTYGAYGVVHVNLISTNPIGLPAAGSLKHEVRPPARELVPRAGRRAGRD
jgi:hypothetical protein